LTGWYRQGVPRRYSTTNRQAQSSATQHRILEAVEELVIEVGPDRVTLKGVSQRSGVALATVYKHFDSRTDLLAGAYHTLAGEINDFVDQLAAACVDGAGASEQLRNLLACSYDALTKGDGRLARIPTIIGITEIDKAQRRAASRRRALLRTILAGADDAGDLELPLDEAVALGMLATSPGLWGDLVGNQHLSRDAAIDLVWHFLALNAFGDAAPASAREPAPRRRPARTA
jgi:AcrR family transcriptional regulator